jgi:nitroimidazol reductase NimA-like FMN-containing flavoprotein (pyridoxamine 5'-phosphate oxidase superfamily)
MSEHVTSQGDSTLTGRSGEPWQRLAESLDADECLRLLAATRVGRLAYTGREGPTVVAVVYTMHEGSIVFHPLQGTFTEEDLRTGIAHAEYQVAFEIDQIDPDARGGWAVLAVGPAHHVYTEAERASIINAGADPFPWPEAEAAPLMRVWPRYLRGRRSYPRAIAA